MAGATITQRPKVPYAIAYKAAKKDGEFVVPGFGKLVKQKRKARTGINPSTNRRSIFPAKP
jgi:DNA-binding protein HU-beta